MDKIPPEILCEIFKYFSFRERRQMALVNTKWYYASIHPQFSRNELFAYYEKTDHTVQTEVNSSLSLFNEFKFMLLNSKRKCFNLKLQGSLYVDHVFPIFMKLANSIVSLCLDNLNIFTDSLLDAILICNKLERLEFNFVCHFAITTIPRKPILCLKCILFNSVILCDYDFNIIMQCAPNLEDLGLKHCNILIWPQALIRFYPNYRNPQINQIFNSNNILSVVNIVNYLETAENINKLRFGGNHKIIFHLPKHIKLTSLELNLSSDKLDNQEYTELHRNILDQKTLENLTLIFVPCCLLKSCIPEFNNLRFLKLVYLELESCNHPNECMRKVVDSLKNKKKLRELKLYTLKRTNIAFILTPLEIPDCTLESLTLYKGPIDSALKIATKGQNLTNLKILNGDILTASDYKLLFKYLINLKKLDIEKCVTLDDTVLSDLPISSLKELVFLRLTRTKLTYQCLKYINNSQLRGVCLEHLSLEPCIALDSLSDFEISLLAFSGFVPELTYLQIQFKETIGDNDIKILDHLPILIKSLHFNLKKLRRVCIN